jgi:hypothetical protein
MTGKRISGILTAFDGHTGDVYLELTDWTCRVTNGSRVHIASLRKRTIRIEDIFDSDTIALVPEELL